MCSPFGNWSRRRAEPTIRLCSVHYLTSESTPPGSWRTSAPNEPDDEPAPDPRDEPVLRTRRQARTDRAVIVLDASAAVSALLNEGQARRIMATDSVHVPHLIDAEVASGLRRQARSGLVAPGAAWAALDAWRRAGVQRYPIPGLLARVWELRDNVTSKTPATSRLLKSWGARSSRQTPSWPERLVCYAPSPLFPADLPLLGVFTAERPSTRAAMPAGPPQSEVLSGRRHSRRVGLSTDREDGQPAGRCPRVAVLGAL